MPLRREERIPRGEEGREDTMTYTPCFIAAGVYRGCESGGVQEHDGHGCGTFLRSIASPQRNVEYSRVVGRGEDPHVIIPVLAAAIQLRLHCRAASAVVI
jgi:hypothetical protein